MTRFLEKQFRTYSKTEYAKPIPWKKLGKVSFFFHKNYEPKELFYHQWPKTFTKDGVEKTYLLPTLCTGQNCPICKLIDWVEKQIAMGDLNPIDVVLKMETSGLYGNMLHNFVALGLNNKIPKDKDLASQEKLALNKLGIYEANKYKQNISKKDYMLFSVVDTNDPTSLQWLLEGDWVCSKLRSAIDLNIDQMQANGFDSEKGNPFIYPVAFDLVYKKTSSPGGDITCVLNPYKALTPEIQNLIEGPMPDDSSFLIKPDLQKMRLDFERYMQIELPLDEFFDGQSIPQGVSKNPIAYKQLESKSPPKKQEPQVITKNKFSKKQEPQVRKIPCDNCGFLVLETATSCPSCGAEAEEEDDIERSLKSDSEVYEKSDRNPVLQGVEDDDDLPF